MDASTKTTFTNALNDEITQKTKKKNLPFNHLRAENPSVYARNACSRPLPITGRANSFRQFYQNHQTARTPVTQKKLHTTNLRITRYKSLPEISNLPVSNQASTNPELQRSRDKRDGLFCVGLLPQRRGSRVRSGRQKWMGRPVGSREPDAHAVGREEPILNRGYALVQLQSLRGLRSASYSASVRRLQHVEPNCVLQRREHGRQIT